MDQGRSASNAGHQRKFLIQAGLVPGPRRRTGQTCTPRHSAGREFGPSIMTPKISRRETPRTGGAARRGRAGEVMILISWPSKKRSQNEACGPNSSLTDASTHLLGRLGCRADAGHCVWILFTFTARGASGRGGDVVLPTRKVGRSIPVLYTTTTRRKMEQTPIKTFCLGGALNTCPAQRQCLGAASCEAYAAGNV